MRLVWQCSENLTKHLLTLLISPASVHGRRQARDQMTQDATTRLACPACFSGVHNRQSAIAARPIIHTACIPACCCTAMRSCGAAQPERTGRWGRRWGPSSWISCSRRHAPGTAPPGGPPTGRSTARAGRWGWAAAWTQSDEVLIVLTIQRASDPGPSSHGLTSPGALGWAVAQLMLTLPDTLQRDARHGDGLTRLDPGAGPSGTACSGTACGSGWDTEAALPDAAPLSEEPATGRISRTNVFDCGRTSHMLTDWTAPS
jgi:hypothetical protein